MTIQTTPSPGWPYASCAVQVPARLRVAAPGPEAWAAHAKGCRASHVTGPTRSAEKLALPGAALLLHRRAVGGRLGNLILVHEVDVLLHLLAVVDLEGLVDANYRHRGVDSK